MIDLNQQVCILKLMVGQRGHSFLSRKEIETTFAGYQTKVDEGILGQYRCKSSPDNFFFRNFANRSVGEIVAEDLT